VVLVILMIMASATIPRLRPMADRSRTREASRSVHLAVDSARNLAMTTGRSCGVMIERLPSNTSCAMTLTQVETPPPYAGDSLTSGGTVTLTSTDNYYYYVRFAFLTSVDGSLAPPLVNTGDLIQFNFQGPWYTITSIAGGSLGAQVVRSQVQNIPWTATASSSPVPYKIMRRPVKSAAAALQLPSPAVIDLTASGTDAAQGSIPACWGGGGETQPLVILFSPNGSVDRVYYESYNVQVTQPIYLLVGKIDGVNPLAGGVANVADLNSVWVAINPATGLVITTDMDSTSDPNLSAAEKADSTGLSAGRHFARQSDAMGGK
jgi:type II secretory pathway pseudopilin PulG